MVDAIYFAINKIFLYFINFHLNGAVKHVLLESPLKLLSQADFFLHKMVCLSSVYKNQWGYGHLPSRCHGGSLGFSNGMKVIKGKKAIWKCIYCWSSLTYFSLHVWGCFKEICRRWETFTAMATHCLYLCVFGPNRLLVWETSAPKRKTSLCLGTAGLVCCLLCFVSEVRGGVFSCPLTDMHFLYSQHTAAALRDSACVRSSRVVTKCQCLCLKDPWERVEWVTGRQINSSQLWPALGREQGLLEKVVVMAGPPAVSILVESLWPDGRRCIKRIGLTCEPWLVTERWTACIWISDFLCDLTTSYFISQSWSLHM